MLARPHYPRIEVAEIQHRRRLESEEEAKGAQTRFSSFIQTNPNQTQDVLADQGQHLIHQPLYGSDM
jgi:hypothetical protein